VSIMLMHVKVKYYTLFRNVYYLKKYLYSNISVKRTYLSHIAHLLQFKKQSFRKNEFQYFKNHKILNINFEMQF